MITTFETQLLNLLIVETVVMQIKILAQKLANKKTQFLPNQADIQAILPTHELVIFTKFHNNWMEIVDFNFNGLFLGQ